VSAACERTSGVDIAAYLDDPGASRWRELHEHAASCAVCAAELAAWKCLRADLGAADEHPSEEQLLAYAESRSSLARDEVGLLSHHLAECASCRDEIAVLDSLRIEPVSRPNAHRERPQRADLLALVGRTLWHPAFAYAVVLALLANTVARLERPAVERVSSVAESKESRDVVMLRDSEAPRAPAQSGSPKADAPGIGRFSAREPASNAGAAPDDDSRRSVEEASEAAPQQPAAPLAESAARLRGLGYLNGGSSGNAESAARSFDSRLSDSMVHRRTESAPAAAAVADLSTPYVAGGRHAVAPAERAGGFRVTFLVVEKGGDASAGAIASGTIIGAPTSARELDVRVVAEDGSRELKTQVEIVRFGRSIEVSIPPGWLEAGTYRVEIRASGSDELVAEPFVLVAGE
jgi:hypothetical protein